MKKFFTILAFAIFIWSALAIAGIISWQAVLGCSTIYAAALLLQIKGKGGRTSMIGCLLIAIIATFIWECGNSNIMDLSFFGKLLTTGLISSLLAVCIFMAVYAIKFAIDAIVEYQRGRKD